jgi:hypothetical protein
MLSYELLLSPLRRLTTRTETADRRSPPGLEPNISMSNWHISVKIYAGRVNLSTVKQYLPVKSDESLWAEAKFGAESTTLPFGSTRRGNSMQKMTLFPVQDAKKDNLRRDVSTNPPKNLSDITTP